MKSARIFSQRSILIRHVLCAQRPSVGSRVLLDPRSRCSGSAKGPPRRYSGSKTFILAETVLTAHKRGEAMDTVIGIGGARMLLDEAMILRGRVEHCRDSIEIVTGNRERVGIREENTYSTQHQKYYTVTTCKRGRHLESIYVFIYIT